MSYIVNAHKLFYTILLNIQCIENNFRLTFNGLHGVISKKFSFKCDFQLLIMTVYYVRYQLLWYKENNNDCKLQLRI
jgi:hypothetical protein